MAEAPAAKELSSDAPTIALRAQERTTALGLISLQIVEGFGRSS